MSFLDRSLVVIETSLAGNPSVREAARCLLAARYRVALLGPDASAAASSWVGLGLNVAPVVTGDFSSAVVGLAPAIAVAPAGLPIPESVPNRLAWSQAPVSRYTKGVSNVEDVSAWVRDYLAPRVPRHFSEQTTP